MTKEKAIQMLEYIRYTGNGESEYKNCAQSIALDMAIKAIEQQGKIEQIIDDYVGEAWEVLEKIKEVMRV